MPLETGFSILGSAGSMTVPHCCARSAGVTFQIILPCVLAGVPSHFRRDLGLPAPLGTHAAPLRCVLGDSPYLLLVGDYGGSGVLKPGPGRWEPGITFTCTHSTTQDPRPGESLKEVPEMGRSHRQSHPYAGLWGTAPWTPPPTSTTSQTRILSSSDTQWL